MNYYESLDQFQKYLEPNGTVLLRNVTEISAKEGGNGKEFVISTPVRQWKLTASSVEERVRWVKLHLLYISVGRRWW
jgi:polyphosphate kinase 2 (PPK2 family)